MVYKSLYGLAPEYLSSNFERQDTVYDVRDSENKLNVSMPRTHSLILWNSFPCGLKEAESLRQFNRLLKRDVQGTAFVESSFFA